MKKFLMMAMCAMLLTGCGTSEYVEDTTVEEEIEVEFSNEEKETIEELPENLKEKDANADTHEYQRESDEKLEKYRRRNKAR